MPEAGSKLALDYHKSEPGNLTWSTSVGRQAPSLLPGGAA
jgi:hypothetical protein